jgi:hypothetical protein
MLFHSVFPKARRCRHISIPKTPESSGWPAPKRQYDMQEPVAVVPLKKGSHDVELSAHWNWFVLLLYGCRRVPASQMLDAEMLATRSLAQLLRITGSVPLRAAQ